MNIIKRRLRKPKWQRVLWKKQDFPDNYVDKNFLRVHKECVKISAQEAHYGSVVVTQEICSCLILFSVFFGLESKHIKADVLSILSVGMCLMAYLITRRKLIVSVVHSGMPALVEISEELRVAIFAVVLTWFSTPLLKTLTESVSTDTIYASTVSLLACHLGCHNYGLEAAIVNPTMSHNLGLFASVCLASRLDTHNEVFALTLVAVNLFTLMPGFRTKCKEDFGKPGSLALSAVSVIATAASLYFYLPEFLSVFIFGIVICTVAIPAIFVYLQPYRQNIYGPWDEALIDDDQCIRSESCQAKEK